MVRISLSQPYRDKTALISALLASSLLSVLMYIGRFFYSGYWTFFFLNWNLFLAWIPLGSALALWHVEQRKLPGKGLRAALFLCWLLFLPNSPYLVTDLIHLTHRPQAPFWYDLILIFSFAWNGLMLGFVSLWIVQEFIQAHWGRFASWLTVGVCLLASGFGIYLGRFLRWNSWDFLLDPHPLLADIYKILRDPLTHPRTLGVTFLFFCFLTVAYITLTLLARVRWVHMD